MPDINASALIDRLARFPEALQPLLRNLPDDQARFKPPSGSWSILEIVRHLADEERDDFRIRLRLTLESPTDPWPGIDPENWARQRHYNEGSLPDALADFTRERAASLQWLNSLSNVDWSITHLHPRGPITAGDLLASWAAHDALHLRQVAKRFYELAARDGAPFKTDYAGPWGP